MGGYFSITPLSSRRAQNRPRHVDAVTVSARPARFGAPMCLMGMSPTHHTIIVIIGAGYAGIMAANRIASHPLATALTRVRLTSTSAHLVERIRLHEALRAEEDPVRPLSELLNPTVDVVIGRATSIDRRRGVVRLSDGALRPSTMSSWQPTAPAGHQLVPGRSPGLTTRSRSAMSFSACHTHAFASSVVVSPRSKPPRNLLSKDSMLRSSAPTPRSVTSCAASRWDATAPSSDPGAVGDLSG